MTFWNFANAHRWEKGNSKFFSCKYCHFLYLRLLTAIPPACVQPKEKSHVETNR